MERSSAGLWGCGAARRGGCVLLLTLLFAPSAARGDDVPATVRAAYDAGRLLSGQLDRGSLEKALRLLEARKDEAVESIDYWELYARTWLGLKKSETELWDVVVEPRRAAAPHSPVFDLVRARLASDAAARRTHLQAALARSVRDPRARVAMACFLLEQKEEDEAERLLEEVLDGEPGHVGALGARARLALSDGLPAEALGYLAEALAQQPEAALYHLQALAYRRQAEDGQDTLSLALAAAAQALGLDPTPEHATTFDELLQETGDAATAAKALRVHFERTRLPMLGALLADAAFRAGDYEVAVLGLSSAKGEDLSQLKGLATAYARLGRAAEAQREAQRVVGRDSRGVLFGAQIDLWLGDAPAALARLGALADPDALRLKAWAHAWAGHAVMLAPMAGKLARDGSREGEDVLVAWLQARLIERLGAEQAQAVRAKLLAARFAAGRQVLAQGGDTQRDIGQVKTAGWPRRAVTYLRGRCGGFLRCPAGSEGFGTTFFMSSGEDKPSVASALDARSDCADEKSVSVVFNRKESKTPEGFIELFRQQEALADFGPAEVAFQAACAACVQGEDARAIEQFDAALTIEPGWYRARVLRAVLRALAPDGEKRDEARDVTQALEAWPDDFDLRRLASFLRAWAGDAALGVEIEALAEREARYNQRNLAGL